MQQITVCLDANVYISGVAFDGKPLKILDRVGPPNENGFISPPWKRGYWLLKKLKNEII